MDVLLDHLPCRQGQQLAVVITLRLPLASLCEPLALAAVEYGVAALDAGADKKAACPDLHRALLVVALESDGLLGILGCRVAHAQGPATKFGG